LLSLDLLLQITKYSFLAELGGKGHCFYYVVAWWIFGNPEYYVVVRYFVAAAFEDRDFCRTVVWPLVQQHSYDGLVDDSEFERWLEGRVRDVHPSLKVTTHGQLLDKLRKSNLFATLDEACAVCALFGLSIDVHSTLRESVTKRLRPADSHEEKRCAKLSTLAEVWKVQQILDTPLLRVGQASNHYKILLESSERGRWNDAATEPPQHTVRFPALPELEVEPDPAPMTNSGPASRSRLVGA
jgi:hypothetical protein